MPAPAATPALPVPTVVVLGARVVEERLALLPHAAKALKETETRARVSTAARVFMPPT